MKPASSPPIGAMVVRSLHSDRYGLKVSVSLVRLNGGSRLQDLQGVGALITGLFAIVILGFAFLLPWRGRDNPVAELERALQAGEFVPFYQPIVDITTGRLRGAEVLMRWKKRDGSILPPVSFIPLAESSGLIVEMTRNLMSKVCEEMGPACRRRPSLRLGFNLAARHFTDESIVRDLRKISRARRSACRRSCSKSPNGSRWRTCTGARRVIAALQGLGVKVAIDDVGAGHSGLSYMLKLGVDIIKIDKMFIDALGSDINSITIVETLVDLARNMRMEIIAEGVENFEQVGGVARARHPRGAGLCLRAAVAGLVYSCNCLRRSIRSHSRSKSRCSRFRYISTRQRASA